MNKTLKKLLVTAFVTFGVLLSTSCSKDLFVKTDDIIHIDGEIKKVELNGSLNQTKYKEFDMSWNLDGLYLSVTNDKDNVTNIPIYNESITYDCYPSTPYRIKTSTLKLEVKNIVYVSENGKSYNVNYKSYEVSVESLDSKETSMGVAVNISMVIFIPVVIFTIVVLMGKKKEEQ